MSSIGIMITSKCDYQCDHCMFTCRRKGVHMDYDTIQYLQRFIAENNIYNINIYGGEPFLDMDHFRNCAYAFYEPEMSFFIATNGSFLADNKRFNEVVDWCYKRFRWNSGEVSGIRISNDLFHDKCRTQKQSMALKSFRSRQKYFDEEIGWYPYENLEANPFAWAEPRHHTSQFIFQIEDDCGHCSTYACVNPSGRALRTGVYTGYHRDISCFMAHDWSTVKSYDAFEDYNPVQVYPDGSIGFCSYCKTGTLGNIKDYSTMKQIKIDMEGLSKGFQRRGYTDQQQRDICDACRKIKSGKIR